jgi:hypothetical protein
MQVRRLSVFTDEIKLALRIALGGDEEYFSTAIANGVCELWEINQGASYCITRLERHNKTKRIYLVCCCYQGKDLDEFAQHLITIADRNDWSLRVHTTNKAIVKWYRNKYNFNAPEYIIIRD